MYIGVTGFTDREQVRFALSYVPQEIQRRFMVGVLATHKTIQGLSGSNENRNPKREEIAGIFPLDWRSLNLVHYCTRDQSALAAQLWSALEWGGPNCDGLQLNIVWPDPTIVAGLRHSRPNIVIVLQINSGAMAAYNMNAERVAEHAAGRYGNLVDYMLVDASGGKGIPLSPENASAYLLALSQQREKRKQSYQLVVAGGLHADNLEELLGPIRVLVPEVGIDVEGRVRTDDTLDEGKVGRYIKKAYSFPVL